MADPLAAKTDSNSVDMKVKEKVDPLVGMRV